MDNEQKHKFQFIGGDLSLDFTNTLGNYASAAFSEYLRSYEDLIEWSHQAGIYGAAEAQSFLQRAQQKSEQAESILQRSHDLRLRLHQLFSAFAIGQKPDKSDLSGLNKELQPAMRDAQILIKNNKIVWDWDDEPLDAPLRCVARAAAELLVSDKLDRVRLCTDEICGWLFLDASKNRSRRWCAMGDCGNRAKSRRYRAKPV